MNSNSHIVKASFSKEDLYTLLYNAEHSETCVGVIRGSICCTLNGFFKEISATLHFPYYFGWNWAAVDECLTDLDWLSFTKILIVIDDYGQLFSAEQDRTALCNTLVKYLDSFIQYWEGLSVPTEVIINESKKSMI